MLREIDVKLGSIENRYFLKGVKPISLQIDTGMHGDEKEVIPVVKDILDTHLPKLKSLLYIPEISPSAVKLETRTKPQRNYIKSWQK